MKVTAIFAALLLCLALAGCGGGGEAGPASGGESLSAAPAPEAEDPVGQAETPAESSAETPESQPGSPASQGETASEPASEAAPETAPKETAYGEGTWFLEAPGDDGITMDRLQFQDGELVFHSYSYPDYGKGGYGESGSDPLEFSPFYGMTLEEASASLESQGRTVTIAQ